MQGPHPAWIDTAAKGDSLPPTPYVVAEPGIAAWFLSASPLRGPVATDHGNKIIWVLDGDRSGDGLHMHVTDASSGVSPQDLFWPWPPGPLVGSGINVPAPGCWRVDLTWGARSARVFLRYEAP